MIAVLLAFLKCCGMLWHLVICYQTQPNLSRLAFCGFLHRPDRSVRYLVVV